MLGVLQFLRYVSVFMGMMMPVQGKYPVISVPGPGVDLDKLPGAKILQGGEPNVNVTIMGATVEAKIGKTTLLHVNTPVYSGDGGKTVHLFGPTLRLKRGDSFTVDVANDLIVSTSSDTNLMHNVGDTNFHTHGLHAVTGKYNQDPTDETTNGDNIFLVLEGKKKASDKTKTLRLTSRLPKDHLPGVHWYHPHVHGSTTSQTYSASGMIVIEDDPAWLPNANGCKQIREVLEDSPDVLLQISLMTFAAPMSADPWNDANIQLVSEVGNSALCCDDDEDSKKALYGTGSEMDLGFINGGWQPTIKLKDGEWQRWRFAMTGFKRFAALQILDENDDVAEGCEMQLIAKDGVYPLAIPRQVSYLLLPSGGRVEVLVRCTNSVSKKLRLSSGHEPLPFLTGNTGGGGGMGGGGMGGMGGGGGGGMGGGGGGDNMLDHSFKQDTLAFIEVSKGEEQEALGQKKCRPLRPDYAADLRDANLKANKATNKIVYDSRATFQGSPNGCTIGGEKFSFPDKAPLQAPMGSIVEWSWFMLWNHPLHLHTNPFQIIDLPSSAIRPWSRWTEYFEVGDYHDTLFLPMVRGSSIPVRLQPGPYYGISVVHCHFLQHEDAGCMKVVEWTCPPGSPGDPKTGMCSSGYDVPVKGTFSK
ncbi:hypothetical protein M9434_000274 [Picochlorum sp. BPE23]|nr:hypothetical protein M9434_000274 [Picochlorum sp. BPE23]